jgi:hypothetical protein
MKTAKQWFELIKNKKIRKEALENIQHYKCSDEKYDSINNSISNGFLWHRTPQGYYYWEKIRDSEIELLQEKPSPSKIIEDEFNNIKTKKQMKKTKISDLEKLVNKKHQELLEDIEELRKDFSKMLDVIESVEITQPQEHKLIMSVDELETLEGDNLEWWKDNKAILEIFGRLKLIENQWNGGKEFDWEGDYKHCLFLFKKEWTREGFIGSAQIFNFHKKEHAELFLETFSKELEIIKPLFS